jgi:hypothetical protein
MDAIKTIETRKSVRGYTGKKVEQDKLESREKCPKGGQFPYFSNYKL